MTRHGAVVTVLTALLSFTGCGRDAYLVDDVDQSLEASIGEVLGAIVVAAVTPPNPFDDPGYSPEADRLHQPYAIGATIGFTLYDEDEQASDLTLESSDPSVMQVLTRHGGRASCAAVGPGVVTLRAVDEDDDVIGSWDLEVAAPDGVELVPYARERAGQPYRFADDEPARVAVGGTSTFEVRYDYQGRRVWGQSDFQASSSAAAAVSISTSQSSVSSRADWLRVTPSEPGSFQVEVRLGSAVVDTLAFEAVDASAVDHVGLVDDIRVGSAPEGTTMVLVAQAYDANDAPIFGAQSQWRFAGDDMPGQGEVFLYSYDPSKIKSVRATVGSVESTTFYIQASDGYVEGERSIGCTLSGAGRRGGTSWWLALALLMRLRRRRSS